MDKVLPILGIVVAALAAIAALVLTGTAYLLFAILVAIGAVFAFMARTRNGVIAGIVLAIAAVVAAFFAMGSITFQGGETVGDDGQEPTFGYALAAAAALLVPAAVIALRWDELAPTWVGYLAGAAVVAAWLVILTQHAAIGEYWAWSNWVFAVLALGAAVPAAMLLRNEPTTHGAASGTA